MNSLRLISLVSGSFLTAQALLLACGDSSADGDDGSEGVPGHCCVEYSGTCSCSAGDQQVAGCTPVTTCDSSEAKVCCAAPFEGSTEPYVFCECMGNKTACGLDTLVQVDRCDDALFHESKSSGTGSCDQCQYDSDCDYGCSSSERGVCSKASGCGSCYCQ